MTRHRVLDGLVLAAATALVAAGFVVNFVLWPGVERVLASSPTEFAAAFGRMTGIARGVFTGLGLLTSVLILISLVREGGLGARRGRLRLLAIVALVGAGLVGALAIDPTQGAILAAARTATSSLAPLIEQWWRWTRVNLGMAIVALVALVFAHRAPLVASGGAGTLSPANRRLLLLLSTATFFEGYDRFIVTLALPYIAHDLGAGEGVLGWSLSVIRGGALLAIVLCLMADRVGRRGVLLWTVLGYTVVTALTGMSRGLADFVALQVVASVFLNTELALSQVVIAEEFPATSRGLGLGLLGAAAAIGAGMAAALFPAFIASSIGWRGLYFVGIVPLLIVGYLRRSLPETTRWQHLDESERRAGGLLGVLAPAHRRRFLVLVAIAAGATAAFAPAFSFASYRATNSFQWTPAQVSTMIITGGGLGFWGWMLFGRLSDVVGRRPTAVVSLIGSAAAIVCFYSTGYLFPAFAAIVFCESGITVSINALSTESFPTALRATARAWVTNASVLGATIGLALVGLLSTTMGGHAPIVTVLGFLPLLLAPVVFLIPETVGRELEVTSGEAGEALDRV
jgi:MFS transporter, putative metabolite:H+ symporter